MGEDMTNLNANALPDHIIRMMDAAAREALKVLTPEERTAGVEKMDERKLQTQCESWLTLHGFRSRTPREILRLGECAGWFVHIHEAKRNPILLDLLVLFADGRYLEIELKTKEGRATSEQHQIIAQHGGKLCRSLQEFIEVMKNT